LLRSRTSSVTSAFASLVCCGVFVGCAERDPIFLGGGALHAPAPADKSEPAPSEFAELTASPQREADPPTGAEEAELRATCGVSDAALVHVATKLIAHSAPADGIDVDALGYDLRAAGAPYVWPHAWRFDGGATQFPEAKARMQRWLVQFADGGERRCGESLRRESSGKLSVIAIAVDVLADLAPLPTRARTGQWLSVSANTLVPTTAAKLVVLGPRGAPHAVPTSFDGRSLRARFNADRAGAWLVQVLAAVEGGPRPLLEALVFAGVEPSPELARSSAPGEEEASGKTPERALYAMIDRARASEGLAPLARAEELEALARAHAEAMRRAHKTAHDAGDGDLEERLERAGLRLQAGENVAHAASAALAQRALWSSPSHRENLLLPAYDSVGVGVAADADGTLWVCEVFASAK